MNACRAEASREFLAGQMLPEAELAYERHIQSCPVCRQALERTAGSAVDWEYARELIASRDEPTPSSQCDETARYDHARRQDRLAAVATLVAPYLAPSDDPAMIGRIGSYEVVGVIGRGGMGIVLKAYERSLNRNVAVKLLDPTLANVGSARARFAREARAMAGVSHPHVVPVYAVDEQNDLPYFVMEYVVGETLEQRIAREGPLPVVAAVRIALQISEGLAAAHAQGLVHRDIKPGNILLDRGTERVRVADFGLARVASDVSQTRSGVLAGTPQYMSPEQVRGERCDARSDLFSLGSVLYAMCAGHAPFRGETVYGTIERVARDRPRGLREQNAETPRWLENLILRLLEKGRSDRIQTAGELSTLLRAELSHLVNPLEVMAPGRPWQRGSRRGRLPAVLAGLAAAMLLVSATFWRALPNQGLGGPPLRPEVAARETPPAMRALPAAPAVPPAMLWDLDGTKGVRERLTALQQTFASEPVADERWHREVAELRARLEALEQNP